MTTTARMTRKEASELGHRAKKAKEKEWGDTILSVADKGLQQAAQALALARVALHCRPQLAEQRVADAQRVIQQARILLRGYFDDARP